MNLYFCSTIVAVLFFACGGGPVDQKEKEMNQNRLGASSVLLPDLVPGELNVTNISEDHFRAVLTIEGLVTRFQGWETGLDVTLKSDDCSKQATLELRYTNQGVLIEGVLRAVGRKVTFTPGKHETYHLEGPPVNGLWLWDFGTFQKSFPMRKVGGILVANVGTDNNGNITASCLLWGEVDPSGEFFLQSDDYTWTGLFHGAHWKFADAKVKYPGTPETIKGTRTWTPQVE